MPIFPRGYPRRSSGRNVGGNTACGHCGGKGFKNAKKGKVSDDGKSGKTRVVSSACGHCNGTGWTPR